MTKHLMARELTSIGKRIEFLLSLNDMTEHDLAKQMKVSVSTISRYINGLRTPNVTNIIAMCRIFHVSADWLLGMKKDGLLELTRDERGKRWGCVSIAKN